METRYVQLMTLVFASDGYLSYRLVPEDDLLLTEDFMSAFPRFSDCSAGKTKHYEAIEEALKPYPEYVMHAWGDDHEGLNGALPAGPLPEGAVIVKQLRRHVAWS